MITFLKWFVGVWTLLVGMIQFSGCYLTYKETGSILETWSWAQDVWSPHNVMTYITTVVLMAPAFAAHLYKESLIEKKERMKTSSEAESREEIKKATKGSK